MKVAVVGKNSFLAREVAKIAPYWTYLSHNDLGAVKDADLIINFAFPPEFKVAYDSSKDIDIKIASANPHARYIMISSRMVYGLGGGACFKENDNTQPAGPYAYAKQETEKALKKILGDRLTILRPGNVFGAEQGRQTFFGHALKTLTEQKKIILDIDPASKKDFMFVGRFASILMKIAADPQPGIFNVGSGITLEAGQVAQWLIEGFGQGEIIVTGRRNDSFCLDSSKLHKTYGITPCEIGPMREVCVGIGASYK